MAGLPRKYAKMGFTKGWRLFKQSRLTPAKKAVGVKMARRKGGFRRKARSASRGGSSLSPVQIALFGLGYGAVRGKLYEMAGKTGMNPRLVLGVAAYFAMTKGRGMVRTAGLVALANEASAQGTMTAAPLLGMSGSTGSAGSVVYL